MNGIDQELPSYNRCCSLKLLVCRIHLSELLPFCYSIHIDISKDFSVNFPSLHPFHPAIPCQNHLNPSYSAFPLKIQTHCIDKLSVFLS